MPCLEITIPKIDNNRKEELAKQLTSAFAKASGFPEEIFGIKFNLYVLNDASSGGVLCNDYEGRPYLHFLLYCPKIKREVKQKLVAEFTEIYTKVIGESEWKPVIHICEHPYDNVGVDGKLLSDAFEQCAESEFYYKLPKD